ncbi:MAG TPA: hypothetical protein VGI65_11570 [Steroidobacteraceae bacterium]|jgi:hypothetical protein
MKTALLGLILAGVGVDANALGRIADVQILDRNTGSILTPYRYRGEYWVAGVPGDRYAILIRNDRGERLLAVTAVDGINVISGENAAWSQSGYVYGPGESYTIDGWRKSNQEIAVFEFTASPNSYAERTGRPANVGVIGVALFLERAASPPAIGGALRHNESEDSARAAPAVPPAPSNNAAAPSERRESLANSAPKLGTGHGGRETSLVNWTEFNRLSGTPNEIIRIRYDSWDNLVAMGVIQPRRPPAPTPNAFPESAFSQFVPDPPSNLSYGRR